MYLSSGKLVAVTKPEMPVHLEPSPPLRQSLSLYNKSSISHFHKCFESIISTRPFASMLFPPVVLSLRVFGDL